MKTSRVQPFRLNRRTMLRGAGTIAIGLPWLEAMHPEVPTARAQDREVAKRFVGVYQPGGSVMARFHPTGTETDFTLSAILEPLAPVLDQLLVFKGVDMKCASASIHEAGMMGLLTGVAQVFEGQYVGGPSIDQVLAETISQGKPRPSIQMAVRWATGKSHGLLHPMNALNFSTSDHSPIPPRIDPVEIFTTLFGEPGMDGGGDMTDLLARKRSILDYVDKRYVKVSQRLGQSDRMKLEAHLTKIREMEQALEGLDEASETCTPPVQVDTSDYNPRAGLSADDFGAVRDQSSDAAIPKVGKFMMDMLVTALACDLTGVATLQWTDTEAKHTFPWLNLSEHHHYYQHDGGFRPDECERIGIWYSEQHSYLLQRMAETDMGGHSLLDESLVFFGSELSDPPTHNKNNMPFLLAGGGGGMQGGRFLEYNGASHNDLLAAIMYFFGDESGVFGEERFSSGSPLSGVI